MQNRPFFKFVGEFYSHWLAAWLGTVSLIVSVVLWLTGAKELSWGGLALAAFICLVVAAYQTWKKKSVELEQELERHKHSDLQGEIKAIFWDFVQKRKNELPDLDWMKFFICIRIVNHEDVPTTIRKYSLQLLLGDTPFEAATNSAYQMPARITHDSNYRDRFSDTNDYKTTTTIVPIEQNIHSGSPLRRSIEQSGWLYFLVRGPFSGEMPSTGQVSVAVEDSLGKIHKITRKDAPIHLGRFHHD